MEKVKTKEMRLDSPLREDCDLQYELEEDDYI